MIKRILNISAEESSGKIISPDFFLLLKLDKNKVAMYIQDENINTNNNEQVHNL